MPQPSYTGLIRIRSKLYKDSEIYSCRAVQFHVPRKFRRRRDVPMPVEMYCILARALVLYFLAYGVIHAVLIHRIVVKKG